MEWVLKGTNTPIGVTFYKVRNELPQEILDKLPTEKDMNKHININGEEDVINNCADVIAEYQVYVQGIPKSDIKEVTCGFQYYSKDQNAWVNVDRGIIKYIEEQKCWRYDIAV